MAGRRADKTREEVGAFKAPAFWRRLDGLKYLTAEKLAEFKPEALYALAGIYSLDEIALSTKIKAELPPDGRYMIREGREDRCKPYWQFVERGCDGLEPRPESTRVLCSRGPLEGKVGAVRLLARRKRSWLFGADWPVEQIAAVAVVDVLEWFKFIRLSSDAGPADDDESEQPLKTTAAQVERNDSAANSKKTKKGTIKRLRRVFAGKRLGDVRLYGPLKLYNNGRGGKKNDSTRCGDLQLFKSVVNELVRVQGSAWREFSITERVPSGSPRAKQDISIDKMKALLYAAGGIVVEEDGGPRRGADGLLVLVALDVRKARAVFGVAILTALLACGRKGRYLKLRYGEKTPPYIDLNKHEINLGGAAVNKTKHAGRVPIGAAGLRFFTAAKRRADSVGAEHVLHKIDGGAYLDLNRKILADLFKAAGLPHMVFHNFKAVSVEAMAVAGHSLAAMSDFSFTRSETLREVYRPGDTSETRKEVAQGFDVAIGGSREEWEALPDRSLGGAARGRNEGLGDALEALTEALDRTYAEANEAAARRAAHGQTSPETRPVAEAAVAESPVARRLETVPAVYFGGAPLRRLSAAIVPNRRELSQAEWAIFAPLARMRAGQGQRFDENAARRALNGMIRLAVTGESWRALPAVYGDNSTVRRAHVRWRNSDVFATARDRALGDRSLTTPERDLLVATCEGLIKLCDRPVPAKRVAPIDESAVSAPLTDEEWEVCSALVGGRRLQLNALLWFAATRSPPKLLPKEYGDPEAARWRRRQMFKTGALDDLASALERGGGPPGQLGPEARAALAYRLRAIAPPQDARVNGAPARAFAPSAVATAPA